MACDALEVDGVRPDIVISKTAITHAAKEGRKEVGLEDMKLASQLTLSHRTRRGGLLEPPSSDDIDRAITRAVEVTKKKEKRKSPTEVPPDESDDESGEKVVRNLLLSMVNKKVKKKSSRSKKPTR